MKRIVSILLVLVMLVATSASALAEIADESYSELMATDGENLRNIALAEVGVSGRPNKYTEWFGSIEGYSYNWCHAFVSWCANQAGILGTKVPRTAGCPDGMSWFANNGRLKYRDSGYVPKTGDIIYFDYEPNDVPNHVGIVNYSDGTNVYTIEGNSGNEVKKNTYSINYTGILAYGLVGEVVSTGVSSSADITLTDYTYPTNLSVGEAFYFKGTIYSRYGFKYAYAGIMDKNSNRYDWSNGYSLYSSIAPSGTTVDIATQMDSDIHMTQLPQGRYYYQIEACDKNGNIVVLLKQPFNVGAVWPSTPTISVSAGKYPEKTTISWNASSNATHYDVRVFSGNSTAEDDLYASVMGTTATSCQLSLPAGTYTVTLASVNGNFYEVYTFGTQKTFTVTNESYAIAVKSEDTSKGTVTGGGAYTYGSSVKITATPQKGYLFSKWSDGNTSASRTVTVNGATTYTAYFTPITYYIKYDGNGATGGSTATSTHTYDVAKNLTKNGYTRTGYTFIGWSLSPTSTTSSTPDELSVKNMATKNGDTLTLYAVWQANTYNLDLNGLLDGTNVNDIVGYGTVDIYIDGKLVKDDISDYCTKHPYGTKWEIKDIKAEEGHIYNGVAEGTISGTIGTSSVAVRLKFDTNEYRLDLNSICNGAYKESLNGWGSADVYIDGVLISDDCDDFCKEYAYGTTYEIKDIKAKPGFTYIGIDETQKPLSGTINTDGIVCLCFEANKYVVKYNANGGTGTAVDSNHTYCIEKELTPNSFSRAGFKFTGWNTKADGTGTSYVDCESVMNLTSVANGEVVLYAQWECIVISVEKVTLGKSAVTLTEGETTTLTVTVTPDNATDKTVVWSTSDANIATVGNGIVTAVGAGEATITANAGGKSANCVVTVKEPVTAIAMAKLTVGNTTGAIGENVTMPIVISENPGIAGFKLKINFDNTVLMPVSIEKGSALTIGTLTSNIQQSGDLSSLEYVSALWSNTANVTNNGEILLVTFKIKDTTEDGTYPVTVTCEDGDVTNQNYEDIELKITNGTVEVASVMIGDVLQDGKVNTKDSVRLNQYLADWEIEFTNYEQAAADIHEDGKINTKDSVKLNQYLADWDVELASLLEVSERKITFEAGSKDVVDGYVDIPVMITENDGVAGFKIRLNYDNTILTPVSITVGDALIVGTLTSNIQQSEDLSALEYVSAFWSSSSNVTNTGVAFTVRFKVKDGISENVPVTLSYVEGDICDQDYNDLAVTLNDGSVIAEKVMDYTVNSLTGEVIDGKFYADAQVTKNTDRAEKDMIVIAVYKNSTMIDMVYMKANFDKGQTVSFGGMLEGIEGATLKAFVWDSMTGMKSLSNFIEK